MNIKILWVDDEHNNHFETLSKTELYLVEQAMDPFQAIQKLSETDFDFVLVDILFRYPPWSLPEEIDVIRKEIGMEPDPVRKGIPLAIWLARMQKYQNKISIFSKLPEIAGKFPQLAKIPAHVKPTGLDATRKFLAKITKSKPQPRRKSI